MAQGGAQDIALFRSIVDSGGVPAPETLDAVGFFAEHAIDLPAADCGEDLCIHPSLAVAPRFDGSNWTMAFIAMNTPVQPETLARPPVHLVLAVESSDAAGQMTTSAFQAVDELVAGLRPEDRVSVVRFGASAATALSAVLPSDPGISGAACQPWFDAPDVDLYAGLLEAQQALEAASDFEGMRRILLVTSGRATVGITDPSHIVSLGEAIVAGGTAFGVVGVGSTFDATIPYQLGSLGAGTYAYAASPSDLVHVLRAEGQTTLFPLATGFQMNIQPAPGYQIGRIYGVVRASAVPTLATLDIPAVFIGLREGASDVGGGRRGGGGGLFVELLADPSVGIGEGAPAFSVAASWTGAAGGVPTSTSLSLANALAPGKNPKEMWPSFSDPVRGKAFMMLNMYLALRASVGFYAKGDCARAVGVVDMMAPSVLGWQGTYFDEDIAADDVLLKKLRQNEVESCSGTTPIQPIEPAGSEDSGGGCMFI